MGVISKKVLDKKKIGVKLGKIHNVQMERERNVEEKDRFIIDF